MMRIITLLAGLMALTLPLVSDLPAQSVAGSGRVMAAGDARNPGPIERPRKLPGGKLIGDSLYCIVLPGHPLHGEEPTVDWEYGLWKYSLKTRRAELLTPYMWFPWLNHAMSPEPLPSGQLLLHYQPWQDYEFEDDFKHVYVVHSYTGSLLETVTLKAYDFERFHMWGHVYVHGELVILKHPHLFKVLTVDAVLNEEDSDYIVEIPLYVGKDGKKRLYYHNEVFPLKLAADGVSPFLVLDDEFFGFRILDREGRLLYQGGQVFSCVFANWFWGLTQDGDALYNFIRASYPESLDMVLYVSPVDVALTEENLVVFYDYYLECIFICSPLGDFYKKIDRPDEYSRKRIVGAGLTGEDGYMLLFDDGWSRFVADYSDIAKQVRSGKLDPLGPLRELMGLEE